MIDRDKIVNGLAVLLMEKPGAGKTVIVVGPRTVGFLSLTSIIAVNSSDGASCDNFD